MEGGGEESGNDSTHLAIPLKVAQMEMCVVLPVNSLCLKSRLNFKVSGGHMGTCFSIFFVCLKYVIKHSSLSGPSNLFLLRLFLGRLVSDSLEINSICKGGEGNTVSYPHVDY